MKARVVKVCACASAVLLFGFVSLYVYLMVENLIFSADPSHAYWPNISIGKFHIAVTTKCGGSLVLFNQEMPYMGSIVSFSGDNSVTERGLTGFGIYFRLIHFIDRKMIWWTLMVNLWYPIIMCGVLPAILVVQKLRGHKLLPHSEGAKA